MDRQTGFSLQSSLMDVSRQIVSDVVFVCVFGPDLGKRIAVRDGDVVIGRSSRSDVPSDDPDVAEAHVQLSIKDGTPRFRTIGEAAVFLDGHRLSDGIIGPKQQVRIGRSFWQVLDGPGRPAGGWIDNLSGRISSAAGLEKVEGFSFSDTFSETFKKRADEEIEEYINVGTRTTTPSLLEVDTAWPKPWIFFRLFTLSVAVYLGFVFAWHEFRNPILIPGLISIGSFLIPFSILVLFFEINVPRNVPLYQVIRLMLMGGILSLILSLFLFRATNLSSWMGAMSAGIVEEIGKASALLLVVHKKKYRWTLNGMLFGAAIGTGFAAFESAGYAFIYGLQGGTDVMLEVIMRRGLLSILGGHVLWTALVGAAIWKVRGDQAFTADMVRDPRFLRVLLLAMGMHMVWNSPIEMPFYAKYVALGFVAWIVILGFIQDGLAQIRREQERVGIGAAG